MVGGGTAAEKQRSRGDARGGRRGEGVRRALLEIAKTSRTSLKIEISC
jgi:hypothetical protein